MRTRADRRAAEAIERRTRESGRWMPWHHTDLPNGGLGQGWIRQVRRASTCVAYVALVRPLATPMGEVLHLAIRTPTNAEPPWRDLQRIKNELVGPERLAVQVCPPASRLIDEADMYHLWVLPEGFAFPFGLHPDDEGDA